MENSRFAYWVHSWKDKNKNTSKSRNLFYLIAFRLSSSNVHQESCALQTNHFHSSTHSSCDVHSSPPKSPGTVVAGLLQCSINHLKWCVKKICLTIGLRL
jgi:hypothetical protein